jgi:hypothetical protein
MGTQPVLDAPTFPFTLPAVSVELVEANPWTAAEGHDISRYD